MGEISTDRISKHGRLAYTKFYLPSPFENGSSQSWRDTYLKRLPEIESTVKVWSPFNKPNWVSPECADNQAALNKDVLFTDGLAEFKYGIRQFSWKANVDARRLCLRLANQADIIIARLPKQFTWGTIKEIEDAAYRGIPIFMVCPDGPLGLFGLTSIISSPELINSYIHYNDCTLINQLKAINDGIDNLPERDPERWLFLTYPNSR